MAYLALLRDSRNFRRYFAGLLISFGGDWFTMVALLTAVESISTSGLAITLVIVTKTLPVFLIAPVAGPLIDRFDRRSILLATDYARAGGALLLVLGFWLENLFVLYACMAAMTACAGIAIPAKNAVLPMIVEREEVPVANALSGGSWSVMLAIGAALGGVATEALGVATAFVIDAGTFLGSAACFYGLPNLPAPDTSAGRPRFVDGLRYLHKHLEILALVVIKPIMHLSGAVLALLPLFGTVAFDRGGPLWVGGLYAIRGVGALVGSIGTRLVFGDRPSTMRVVITGAFFGLAGSYALLGAADDIWTAALAYSLSGLTGGAIWVTSGTLLQLEADRAFHGRVFAVEFGVLTLVLATSSFVGGALVDNGLSPQDVATCFSPLPLLGVVASVVGSIVRRRRSARASGRAG